MGPYLEKGCKKKQLKMCIADLHILLKGQHINYFGMKHRTRPINNEPSSPKLIAPDPSCGDIE